MKLNSEYGTISFDGRNVLILFAELSRNGVNQENQHLGFGDEFPNSWRDFRVRVDKTMEA